MKHLKWIVPLAVVVLLLLIALPAAADDPFGGPPSKTSGNGTSTWAAIYAGGTWDYKGNEYPDNTFSILTGNVSTREYNKYVTNWTAKVTIPAFSSRWFKFDTVRSRDVEVYLDDVPKWGAAYRYFDNAGCVDNKRSATSGAPLGASGYGSCDQSDNLQRIGVDTGGLNKGAGSESSIWRNGFLARIYGPSAINQMDYFWPTPNNALLTTRDGSRPRVADSQGGYGGFNRGGASLISALLISPGGNYIYLDSANADTLKWGDGNTHLLAGKFHLDGWVYVRVSNVMIWDNDMMLGTRYTPNGAYDFPNVNNPIPFNNFQPPLQ
jgi:hypothetical protein